MTKEEAIQDLKLSLRMWGRKPQKESYEMAIQALEKNYDEEWRKEHYKNAYNQGFLDGVKAVEKRDKKEDAE